MNRFVVALDADTGALVDCWPGHALRDYDPARVTQWQLDMKYNEYRPEAIAQAKAIHAALDAVCGFGSMRDR